MREVTSGVCGSDMGLWPTDAAATLRERRRLASQVAVFMNVVPEFASPLDERGVETMARSVAVSAIPDAILISGPMAGAEPDLESLREARAAVGLDVAVLVNTGTKSTNTGADQSAADGCIVGGDFKVDDYTWNPVGPERVRRFMEAARA